MKNHNLFRPLFLMSLIAIALPLMICPKANAAQALVVIGIDFTLTDFDTAAICNSVKAYLEDESRVSNGSHIIAIVVYRNTFTKEIILAKATLPSYAGIKGRERCKTINRFIHELHQGLAKRQSFPDSLLRQSRINDFFYLAETKFVDNRMGKKDRKMLLYSDMLQVDDYVNFERDTIGTSHLHLPRVGGSISVIGVQSPKYRDRAMWNTIREVWLRLFESSKIKVLHYSPTL